MYLNYEFFYINQRIEITQDEELICGTYEQWDVTHLWKGMQFLYILQSR